MKQIGVVRRIDNLGRIVIPKEMRKVLHISDGESLELNVVDDNIVLKKYSTIKELDKVIQLVIDMLKESTNCNILVTDLEKVIYSDKDINKLFCGKLISEFAREKIINRNKYLSTATSDAVFVSGISGSYSFYLVPLLSSFEPVGSIIIFSDNLLSDKETTLCDKVAKYINEYIEY